MRRIFCIMLCLVLLSSFAVAAKEESLEDQINGYIYNNGLNKDNFALSYFNTVTGEGYNFNEGAFFAAGEVWLLPLHMYYCVAEDRGDFKPEENDPDYNNPNYEYTINGMNLDTCRTEGIFKGNQTINAAMRDEINQYPDVINEELGHIEKDLLPQSYYTDNTYSTEFLMNCMIKLEHAPEVFGHLLTTYNMVQVPGGFRSAEYPLTNQYTAFQICAEDQGMLCAVAEVSAADTYLLTCFISKEAGGEQALAEINSIICEYVQNHSKKGSTTSDESTNTGLVRTESSFQVTTDNSNNFSGIGRWILIAFAAAAALIVVFFVIDRIIRSIKNKNQ